MRPCRSCNAALENNETVCPECGSDESTRPCAAPVPPQTHEQIEERKRGTRRLFIAHVIVVSWFAIAVIGTIIGVADTATIIAMGFVLVAGFALMLFAD